MSHVQYEYEYNQNKAKFSNKQMSKVKLAKKHTSAPQSDPQTVLGQTASPPNRSRLEEDTGASPAAIGRRKLILKSAQ